MRTGTVYKRSRCGRKFVGTTCENCSSDQFSWAYIVDVGPIGGRRQQRSRSGFGTKREAVRALAIVQGEMARGDYIAPSDLTVTDYLVDKWLPAISLTIRPSTLLTYETHVVKHIVPAIGHYGLQSVRGGTLNEFYAQLLSRGQLSHTTVRHIHTTLRGAFRHAVQLEHLRRNPADQATPPSRSRDQSPKTWSRSDLSSFLSSVSTDRMLAAWTLLATTGMRRGEALGLKWDDMDLEEGWASINRSLITVGYRMEMTQPKTMRGRRRVALDRRTNRTLQDHRKNQLEERLAYGEGWTKDDLVFVREDGRPTHPMRSRSCSTLE